MLGVGAIAAPIFDYRGQPVGHRRGGAQREFDSRRNGDVAKSIRSLAGRVSTQLGYVPERVARAASSGNTGEVENTRTKAVGRARRSAATATRPRQGTPSA